MCKYCICIEKVNHLLIGILFHSKKKIVSKTSNSFIKQDKSTSTAYVNSSDCAGVTMNRSNRSTCQLPWMKTQEQISSKDVSKM